ncbi:MAG TPA: hypothetical protein VFX45_01555 [Solirubrobacterales bacterium]|nr:hypothetical protein [Solirubrobacterales bacterium]
MTRKTRSFRPSPALVISCLALFLAMAGSAFAVGVAKNSVRSAQIVDGTVRAIDVRDNAVNAAKIAPDAVGTEEIAENAVGSPEVAQDSLTTGDLGNASVASPEVADQSLTSDDLGPNSVGSSEIQTGAIRASELGTIIQVSSSAAIKGGGNASASVACPAGTTVISGGSSAGFYQVHVAGSYRAGNGWHLDARSGAVGDTTITVFAYCLSGGSSN